MPAKSVIVVGDTALDRVYRIDAFPPKPTKLAALDHREEGGGSGANAAAAIARLGGSVALWSRIGDDDPGLKARRDLERLGVDVTQVRACESAKTPTSAVIVDAKGERLVVSETDPGFPVTADWLPLDVVREAGAVLSDLTWLEATEAAFAAARELGLPTLLDVDIGTGVLFERVAHLVDYAIFSAPAFLKFVSGADEADRFAALRARGLKHGGVTRGAGGYIWHGGQGAGDQPGFPVPVVDTTGAGDTFHGAFALAVASGLGDQECARLAAATAALKCRRLGARLGLPDAVELDAFLVEQTGAGLPEGFLTDKPRLLPSAERQ